MKYPALLFLGHKNSEDLMGLDLKQIDSNIITHKQNSAILVEINNIKKEKQKIVKLFLSNHTSKQIFLIFGQKEEELLNNFTEELLKKDMAVAFRYYSETDIENKIELEAKKAKKIFTNIEEKLNRKLEYNIKNPEVLFSEIDLNNKKYFGLNLTNYDLSKRDYKIYKTQQSIKGTIASLALIFADYPNNTNKIILDPICAEGVIPIEAAFFKTKESPYRFIHDKLLINRIGLFKQEIKKQLGKTEQSFFKEKSKSKKQKKIFCFDKEFKNVDFAKKNSHVCQMAKQIEFSRIDVDWLDIRLKDNKVDFIITKMPLRFNNEKQEKEFYDLFFQRADQILNKTGTIVLISRNEIKIQKSFKLIDKKEIFSGKEKYLFSKIKKV